MLLREEIQRRAEGLLAQLRPQHQLLRDPDTLARPLTLESIRYLSRVEFLICTNLEKYVIYMYIYLYKYI